MGLIDHSQRNLRVCGACHFGSQGFCPKTVKFRSPKTGVIQLITFVREEEEKNTFV
jgi:hypothetical protein